MFVKQSVAFLVLLMILHPAVWGREIFVSPGGSDGAEGGEAAPLKTLNKALDTAKEGDTITLRNGTYEGKVVIRTHRLTLQSYPGERAVVKSPGEGTNVMINWRDEVVLRNIDFEGGAGYGVDFNKSRRSVMEGCRVYDVDGEIVKVSPGSNNVTIRSCEIFNNRKAAAEGIDAVSVDHLTVQDCYIHDIGKTGAYSKGGSRWCLYERNLIMRCGLNDGTKGMGLLLGQAGGTANNPFNGQERVWQNAYSVARNNIIVDIEGAGFGAWGALEAKFYNNTLVNVAKSDRAGVIILGGSKDVTIVNNIVQVGSNRHLLWIYGDGLMGNLVMDNNCYRGGSGMFWDERAGGGTFRFEQWREKYGVDAGSIMADPGLDADYHLTAESPCLGKGMKIAEVKDDYEGAPRPDSYSIGADELQARVLAVPPPKGCVGTGGAGSATAPGIPEKGPEKIAAEEHATEAPKEPPKEPRAVSLEKTFIITSEGDGEIQDTMLKDDGRADFAREDDGMRSYGQITADSGRDGRCRFPLIRFDLSAVPEDTVIVEARMELFCFGVNGTGGVSAYPLREDWKLEKACFNFKDAREWWNEGGKPFDASAASGDFDAAAKVTNSSVRAGAYNSWDVTALVREWRSGVRSNNGLVLMADGPQSEAKFYSVNHNEAGKRPRVVVTLGVEPEKVEPEKAEPEKARPMPEAAATPRLEHVEKTPAPELPEAEAEAAASTATERATMIVLLVGTGVVLVVGVLLVAASRKKGRGGRRTYRGRKDGDDA